MLLIMEKLNIKKIRIIGMALTLILSLIMMLVALISMDDNVGLGFFI